MARMAFAAKAKRRSINKLSREAQPVNRLATMWAAIRTLKVEAVAKSESVVASVRALFSNSKPKPIGQFNRGKLRRKSKAIRPAASSAAVKTTPANPPNWLICLLLAIIVLAAYRGVSQCGFVSLDDPAYVSDQPMIRYGLRPAAIIWAFASTLGANWHPLTCLSHMLDCTLFGLSPAPPHWENVLFHTANTLLVFILFRRLTSRTWISTLVAALFGLHPLHVESVAWISERKDVLCAFFWLLGLVAYERWARAPSRKKFLLVGLCCLLALLAKPMAVSFPITLLLLDYWPLRRWSASSFRQLLREKIPVISLAAAFCVITFLVQQSAGAMTYGEQFSFPQRLTNALVSYARYLDKMFWPHPLSVQYPLPRWWPWWTITGAALLLVALTAFTWWQRHRRRWILFGWVWFLLTLVPTIGLVQVGVQAMADRYTYIPSLGIFLIVAMGLFELAERWKESRPALVFASIFALGILFVLTGKQVMIWKDGCSLFEHSVEVAPGDYNGYVALAEAMKRAGLPEAEIDAAYRRALELKPDDITTIGYMASFAIANHHYTEAHELLAQAQRIDPKDFRVPFGLAMLASSQQQPAKAITDLRDAVGLNPRYEELHRELARLYFMEGRYDDADRELKTAIQLNWWDAVNHEKLGLVLERQGRVAESRASLKLALWIDPGSAEAPAALARLNQMPQPDQSTNQPPDAP